MTPSVAVVIPCYKVSRHIMGLLGRIGAEVQRIYVVDDCCPEGTGTLVQSQCKDARVQVLTNPQNQGVGGAVMTGYKAALRDGVDIVVKIDGDGQMPPELIPTFIDPIVRGLADYTKGNRFFSLDYLGRMPPLRIFGNTVLSFVSKACSGYWNLMDPTNGYTAVHTTVLAMLPLEKIHKRYFFESDMLFRLNIVRAVVHEMPMQAVYASEKSSMSLARVALEFPAQYLTRMLKRIFYNYFLRDFNICSLQILSGCGLLGAGALYGGYHWYHSYVNRLATPIGIVMLASLLVILGFQLLLSATVFDTMNIPQHPLHTRMRRGTVPPLTRES